MFTIFDVSRRLNQNQFSGALLHITDEINSEAQGLIKELAAEFGDIPRSITWDVNGRGSDGEHMFKKWQRVDGILAEIYDLQPELNSKTNGVYD